MLFDDLVPAELRVVLLMLEEDIVSVDDVVAVMLVEDVCCWSLTGCIDCWSRWGCAAAQYYSAGC